MNTLKYLQNNEFLLDVDLWRLFANLEELNKVSRKREVFFRSEINQPSKRRQQPKSFYLVSTTWNLVQIIYLFLLSM